MKSYIYKELRESYKNLIPWSNKYNCDFNRFLFSLNFLDRINIIKSKRILDIGCGIGLMICAINNLGGNAIGIDKFVFLNNNEYSPMNSNKLKNLWKKNNIKIINGDVVNDPLPFPNNYFDVVNMDAFIEHLPESPKRLFSEIYRVLKNDGYVLISTPNLVSLVKRLQLFSGRSPSWDIKDYFEKSNKFLGHRREFTAKELKLMLELSGFRFIETKSSNTFLNIRRLQNPRKIISQLCSIISLPFSNMREMIFIIARK